MPSPGHVNLPSALGLLADAVEALEQRSATPVDTSQPPPSNAQPDEREIFQTELHGEDDPPRSITPDLDPDIAAIFGDDERKSQRKEAVSV